MQHKCKYFHYVDGELICVQCGKPAHSEGTIEDKMVTKHEDKTETKYIFPPESKRITKKKAKRR